ncbi:MAG TPA: NUDIX hydrolase [Candidatus Saccharimonadales bacterium]|nr:NUDIX hydrolase [Candidatus Saccharimonadales bacterium]
MITHVVAKTLVFDETGKLLLLKRSVSDNHRPGGLDLPGGKVEEGEEIVAGALREVKEESGLVIDPQHIDWVYADTVAAYNTDHKTNVNMLRATFIARVHKPKVTLSHEHDAYSWHTIDEALIKVANLRYELVLRYLIKNDIASEYWKNEE